MEVGVASDSFYEGYGSSPKSLAACHAFIRIRETTATRVAVVLIFRDFLFLAG